MKKCVIKECDGKRRARGLCPACYQRAKALVNSGVRTWDQLVKQKVALPLYQSKLEKQLKLTKASRKTRAAK